MISLVILSTLELINQIINQILNQTYYSRLKKTERTFLNSEQGGADTRGRYCRMA